MAYRLHERQYYVTATTGAVDRVCQAMLRWNAEWRLDVDIANVTSAWCGVNLAGPNSRAVLQSLCEGLDLSTQAFPFMGVREGKVAGIPARLLRVGFVGELGYEIHAPQHGGLIARLSEQEFLILQGLEADPGLFATLQGNWLSDAPESVHPLPRADSHCWLALSGALASEALAKLCAVDLSSRSFGLCDVAQTSLARVNAIILRQDLGITPCFHILSDASSAEYLWDVLLDAMREFGGAPVGLEALRTLKLRDRPSESFSPTERNPRIQPRKASASSRT